MCVGSADNLQVTGIAGRKAQSAGRSTQGASRSTLPALRFESSSFEFYDPVLP